MPSWIDHLLVAPQYLVPQHGLSKFAKYLAQIEQPAIKSFLIKRFLGAYEIDLDESNITTLDGFRNFNAFFTRRLKPDARPVAPQNDAACSPADGVLSQFGIIDQGHIIQAKNQTFRVKDLLAEPDQKANRYENGCFATIYLAPNNYHRVHTPFGGEILSVRYVPGDLFSVNRRTAASVKGLFARNERVLVEIHTQDFGRVMVILVGALLVASIGLSFFDMESFVYARKRTVPTYLPITGNSLTLEKGQEIGWFNMGSTVVLLFENDGFAFDSSLARGQKIRMGEKLGGFARTQAECG